MAIKEGDILYSATGRALSPVPRYKTKSSNKWTMKLLLSFDAWKVKEAILEAKSRNDEWNEILLSRIKNNDSRSYSQAEMDYVGDYLFGDKNR